MLSDNWNINKACCGAEALYIYAHSVKLSYSELLCSVWCYTNWINHKRKKITMLKQVSIKLLAFVAIITSIVSAETPEDLNGGSWFGPEFSVLQKVYDDCQNKNDFSGCLKGKALLALTKAVDQVSAQLIYSVNKWWSTSYIEMVRNSLTESFIYDHCHIIGFDFHCGWSVFGETECYQHRKYSVYNIGQSIERFDWHWQTTDAEAGQVFAQSCGENGHERKSRKTQERYVQKKKNCLY